MQFQIPSYRLVHCAAFPESLCVLTDSFLFFLHVAFGQRQPADAPVAVPVSRGADAARGEQQQLGVLRRWWVTSVRVVELLPTRKVALLGHWCPPSGGVQVCITVKSAVRLPQREQKLRGSCCCGVV